MNTVEHYLSAEAYNATIEAILTVQPDPFTGKVERHQLVEILGEIANVWPVSVLDDPERDCVLGGVVLKVAS